MEAIFKLNHFEMVIAIDYSILIRNKEICIVIIASGTITVV